MKKKQKLQGKVYGLNKIQIQHVDDPNQTQLGMSAPRNFEKYKRARDQND